MVLDWQDSGCDGSSDLARTMRGQKGMSNSYLVLKGHLPHVDTLAIRGG